MSKDQTTCFFFRKKMCEIKDFSWHCVTPTGRRPTMNIPSRWIRWLWIRWGLIFEPMTQDNYGIFVFSVDAAAWKPSPNGLISVLLCYFKLVKLTIPPGSFQTRRWMILEFAPCPSCFLRCLHIPDHNNHRVSQGILHLKKCLSTKG